MTVLDIVRLLWRHIGLLIAVPLIAAVLAFGYASTIAPTFTARTVFLPPQQQQSSAAAALASLGALASLAGGGGARSPAEQYLALMQSVTVADRLIEQFQLMQVYGDTYRVATRRNLATNTRMTIGKKDGLISIEVDDKDPARAAAIANQYVEELRRMTGRLAVTEAQQRRSFFEQQLQQTKERLTAAQLALQGTGFSPGALRAEPRAAAEAYARTKAEVTAAEVRLQAMRGALADATPEVQRGLATLAALRAQLTRLEQSQEVGGNTANADYIGRLREFKYQETLFELFARQYEVARVDEAREGALIQVVDPAVAPELKSRPKRLQIAIAAALASVILLLLWLLGRHAWQRGVEATRIASSGSA